MNLSVSQSGACVSQLSCNPILTLLQKIQRYGTSQVRLKKLASFLLQVKDPFAFALCNVVHRRMTPAGTLHQCIVDSDHQVWPEDDRLVVGSDCVLDGGNRDMGQITSIAVVVATNASEVVVKDAHVPTVATEQHPRATARTDDCSFQIVRMFLRPVPNLATTSHDGLDGRERLDVDKRFVAALVFDTSPGEQTQVEAASQDVVDVAHY
ncbi:MAG: hypothetical protein ABSC00_07285 [Acidimicrobiales bacterium]